MIDGEARGGSRSCARPARLAGVLALSCGLLVASAVPAAAQVQLDTAGPGTAVGMWISRLVNHLGIVTTVGLLLVPAWLLRAAPGAAPSAAEVTSVRRAARLATVAALVWAFGTVGVLLFGLSNTTARALPEALTGDLIGRFLGTRFGTAVALQLVATLVVVLLIVIARGRRGWSLALAAALLAAMGTAWWGHAGTTEPAAVAFVSSWLHICAAALWVGGLIALAGLVLPPDTRLEPVAPTARFSALAGWAIVLVAITGVVNTLLHVTAPSQLVGTTWGRLVLAKTLLLIALAGFGWAHRRRGLPRLRRARRGRQARRAFLRVAAAELVVMLAAIGLATTMASGVPASVEAAERIQAFTAPLGEGLVEVSLDPARVGRNQLHLYLYDAANNLRPVDAATVLLTSGDLRVEPRLVGAGPGHYTGPSVEVPVRGLWSVRIRIEADGVVEEATGTLGVR